jgi:hypothetical protein
MGQGELLPDVHFSSTVHEDLTEILVDLKSGPRVPRPAAEVIIRRLEEIAAIVPALARPDVKAARAQLEAQRKAARTARRALDRASDLAAGLLTGELKLRGWDAAKFMASLRAGLVELEQAIMVIEARSGRLRGGAPADGPARFLVTETERELTAAGVRVTHYEDGTLANPARLLETDPGA